MASTPLRIGTRGSALARWQAEWVAAQLAGYGVAAELVPIVTSGDRAAAAVGGESRGLFTKEIQHELVAGRIDLAVHSLKDLPTETVPGLQLAVVPPRASVADVLVAPRFVALESLPAGARVGTGSLRRRAQLLHVRPDLQMHDLRGNVDTRLRKVTEGQYEAIVLAEAGLCRLELAGRITQIIPLDLVLPAVGQGALGLEIRRDDRQTAAAIAPLDDPPSHAAVVAERAMLAALEGGCLAPIAAWGRAVAGHLELAGRVLSPDGVTRLDAHHRSLPAAAEDLGRRVAGELLAQGAAQLVAAGRTRQADRPNSP
jgi:hydroxymethylbilane synthase